MLTMGDSPSYHSHPAVLHLGNLLHSLAIGIARDKSHEYSLSTRKLSLTSKIVLVKILTLSLFVKLSLKPKLSSEAKKDKRSLKTPKWELNCHSHNSVVVKSCHNSFHKLF